MVSPNYPYTKQRCTWVLWLPTQGFLLTLPVSLFSRPWLQQYPSTFRVLSSLHCFSLQHLRKTSHGAVLNGIILSSVAGSFFQQENLAQSDDTNLMWTVATLHRGVGSIQLFIELCKQTHAVLTLWRHHQRNLANVPWKAKDSRCQWQHAFQGSYMNWYQQLYFL